MGRAQAVIFDMDGLMIDSEPVQRLAVNATLRSFGVELGEDEWALLVGRRATENFQTIVDRFGLAAAVDDLVTTKNDEYRKLIAVEVTPMPGLYEALDACERAGLNVAVASSSFIGDIEVVLAALGLDKRFDAVVSGDMVRHAKPDPEIFLEAAKRLGVEPSRCIVLEDTEYGVKAAKAAGMACVAVPNGYTAHHDVSGADLVLGSLSELDAETLSRF